MARMLSKMPPMIVTPNTRIDALGNPDARTLCTS
jgi:hypothetical protein